MDEAPRLAELVKKRLFWLVSRVAMGCYRRVPIFGRLRASIGIIRDGDRVLLIRRNDGRGLSFPGGLAYPWETEDQALVREFVEETGLSVKNFEFVFRYDSSGEIPARIAVFETRAEGKLRGSWEGTPDWVELAEARAGILRARNVWSSSCSRTGTARSTVERGTFAFVSPTAARRPRPFRRGWFWFWGPGCR